jgi:site-specific DNA recombinase
LPWVGGGPLDKTALHRLLSNPLYSGRVKYKRERHAGEHVAIIEPAVFDRVQTLLKRNRRTSDTPVRTEFGALLKGLLRCAACGCAMTPAHSTKNRTKRYRYYVCTGAQKRGWDTCPSKSVPAAELEQFVIDRIRGVGKEPTLLQATVAEACRQDDERLAQLEIDRRGLERDLARLCDQEREYVRTLRGTQGDDALARLAEVQEQIRQAESRLCRLKEEASTLRRSRLDETDLALALSAFDPVWGTLTPREQARMVQLLVERVDYDGRQGKVAITFQPTGIQTLADELTQRQAQEKRA